MIRRSLYAAALGLGLCFSGGAQASVVSLTYDLDLNGMSAGTCPGGICGTVKVVGDTTSSLTYTVDLATGVSFHANHGGNSGTGPFFYFELTDPHGPAITFSNIGTSGSISGKAYSYDAPTAGSFVPNPGNFPGTYDFDATCANATAGKICGGPFTFKASGATTADPFVIGSPSGHGLFAGDQIAFVADLSISGSCGNLSCAAGTGFVGSSLVVAAVPESSTWAMMMFGFAGLGFMAYRRKQSINAFRQV